MERNLAEKIGGEAGNHFVPHPKPHGEVGSCRVSLGNAKAKASVGLCRKRLWRCAFVT